MTNNNSHNNATYIIPRLNYLTLFDDTSDENDDEYDYEYDDSESVSVKLCMYLDVLPTNDLFESFNL